MKVDIKRILAREFIFFIVILIITISYFLHMKFQNIYHNYQATKVNIAIDKEKKGNSNLDSLINRKTDAQSAFHTKYFHLYRCNNEDSISPELKELYKDFKYSKWNSFSNLTDFSRAFEVNSNFDNLYSILSKEYFWSRSDFMLFFKRENQKINKYKVDVGKEIWDRLEREIKNEKFSKGNKYVLIDSIESIMDFKENGGLRKYILENTIQDSEVYKVTNRAKSNILIHDLEITKNLHLLNLKTDSQIHSNLKTLLFYLLCIFFILRYIVLATIWSIKTLSN